MTDCEHLVRRMLVLEPKKRFSIRQIKSHRWMTCDGGQPKETNPGMCNLQAGNHSNTVTSVNPSGGIGDYNEQILRLMQSLGIDQSKTLEVRLKKCFSAAFFSENDEGGRLYIFNFFNKML